MTALVPRVSLVLLALALAGGAFALQGERASSGNWSTGAAFDGTATAQSPQGHAFDVALPAAWDEGGVRVNPAPAELSLRASGPLDAPAFLVDVVDATGARVLAARLDPGNPFPMPHGPPSAAVGSGAYTIRVAPAEGEQVQYAFSAVLLLPFSAGATGLIVPPLLPWGLATLALLGALFPLPRLARGNVEVTTE